MAEHADFAPLVLKLLKGPIYYDDPLWGELLILQRKTADYLGRIGLELVISESEGFAFISQKDGPDEEELPRLTPRRPLSFEVSLLAILIREEMERFDPEKSDSLKVFITRSQIREKLRIYFPESGDEVRLVRDLDKHIAALERMRYIRTISGEIKTDDPRYEILPIIKARVTPNFVDEFRKRIEGEEA